jgi:Tol biopolymer transport system component
MDLDGKNQKQLTFGKSEYSVSVTPDSKWLYYDSTSTGTSAIWKVSIEGGEAVKVTDRFTENAEIAPDGKRFVCEFREDATSTWQTALFNIDGTGPLRVLDALNGVGNYRWAPDGRSITYHLTKKGISNIWSYPLDGREPKQLTDFKNDQIFNFKWSPDGQSLVVARGTVLGDLVMIRDFR